MVQVRNHHHSDRRKEVYKNYGTQQQTIYHPYSRGTDSEGIALERFQKEGHLAKKSEKEFDCHQPRYFRFAD